jgi:archaellum component FlaF (FlaF/FlaG flagellin family)|tara:strand:- start:681 stop:1055 length:375 start_codon:yes stop_codon:yes gene_type:complete
MTKKSKLNQKATATLVEYRTALDIKNSIDKLVSQLKNEFTEIVNNHKLVSDKKNFVFDFDNETFVISQSNRDILNQSEVKKLLTSKKLAIPYKTSTSVSIKNVSGTANNVDNELIKMLKVGTNA